MAHFFTKHEMKKYDKKLEEENYLDTNRFKSQLKDEISRDNHRTNIDSAKKKAVLQGMNYDGFHQMVLGADLKGIKQGEIYSINSEKTNTIMNNISTSNKFNNNVEILQNAFTLNEKENIPFPFSSKILKEGEHREDNVTFDQKNFIKEFKFINNTFKKTEDLNIENEKLNENLDKKLYLIFSYAENFNKILEEGKLPSDIFLDLVNSLAEILLFFLIKKEIENAYGVFGYLKIFFSAKFFSSSKIFIGKKQKNMYSDIALIMEEIIPEIKEENEIKKYEEILNFMKNSFK